MIGAALVSVGETSDTAMKVQISTHRLQRSGLVEIARSLRLGTLLLSNGMEQNAGGLGSVASLSWEGMAAGEVHDKDFGMCRRRCSRYHVLGGCERSYGRSRQQRRLCR